MSAASALLLERIGAVTDEVDLDIADAVHTLLEWGVRHAHVRSIGDARVPSFSGETLARLADAAVALDIGALSPGLFKGSVRGEKRQREMQVMLPESIRLAVDLGVPQVVVFGGGAGEPRDAVIEILGEAAERARAGGVELILENSSLCHVATCDDLVGVAEALDLRVVWDPANAVAAGDRDLVAGSRQLAHRVASVHVRDWHPDTGWRRLGRGVMPWRAMIGALESEGYRGRYIVESHLPADPGATEWNVDALVSLLRSSSRE
ncbi:MULTISPECIES: sugar phosphate isomerase/epimerase family protein [unclassified Microbacterium]|uniref:sugar phosphate isomerase/epimerase family protein n=1 Tax=unclassified Microbacterium TaxID=2609290 RepID=UPI0015E30ACF|nr:sugar phosphate isomerase/epimerase family protein [Microbacterium sp. MYb45]